MAIRVPKLEKAFRRHPGSPLFARLADLYLGRGMVLRALDLCEKGCEQFPEYTTGFLVLSSCYEARGDLANARRAMSKALRLDPENPAGFKRLSRIHRDLGNADLALSSLKQAYRLDPLDAGVNQEISQLSHRVWVAPMEQAEETSDLLSADADEPAARVSAGVEPAQTPAAGTPQETGVPVAAASAPTATPVALPGGPAAGPAAAAADTPGEGPNLDQPDGGLAGLAGPSAGAAADEEARLASALEARDDGELTRLFGEIEMEEARARAGHGPGEEAATADGRPAETRAEEDGSILPIATVTLAHIYSLQGLHERAIEVCLQVLGRDPGSERAQAELASLQGKVEGQE